MQTGSIRVFGRLELTGQVVGDSETIVGSRIALSSGNLFVGVRSVRILLLVELLVARSRLSKKVCGKEKQENQDSAHKILSPDFTAMSHAIPVLCRAVRP